MTDIAAITENLTLSSNGIWVAKTDRAISYPEDGHEACFAVEDTSFWFGHRNNVIKHLVDEYSPGSPFFDIGGGNGCVSSALQGVGVDVALIEPGVRGAHNAKERGVGTVIQSTLEDAGFAPGSIPSAGLFDVVEHIEMELDFLRLVHHYMQPSGKIYITVPAFQFLWSQEDASAGHFRRYTTQSLTEALSKAGFAVEYCSYFFAFLVPPIFLLRSIPSRLGFRDKSDASGTTKKEHSSGSGLVNAVLQKCLNVELKRIQSKQQIFIGSSCVAVATKK